MSATSSPVFATTYRGDHSDIVERREVMGPNRMGEYFMAKSATYNPETDKTRVEFALLPMPRSAA